MRRSGATAAASIERFLDISLLALVWCGALSAAVCGWWDAPTLALTAVALVWRGARLAGARPSPPPAAVAVIALAWCGFSIIDAWNSPHGFLGVVIPLFYFLAAAILLVATTGRDNFRVALLCFAALLAGALDSTGPGFFLALACFVPCTVAALAAAEILRSLEGAAAQVPARRLAPRLVLLTCLAAASILLLATGLFFLLPRTADAARRWQLPHARLIDRRRRPPSDHDATRTPQHPARGERTNTEFAEQRMILHLRDDAAIFRQVTGDAVPRFSLAPI